MQITALGLSALLASLQPAPSPVEADPDAIVVTGEKHRERAEEPYSTTPRVMTGTRIAKKPGRRMFYSVATDTGLAGLIGGAGGAGDSGFDGTGGRGLVIRNKRVTECRADREEVSEATACALFDADRAMLKQDYAAARAALAPILATRNLNSFDRYYAGHYAYRLAELTNDASGREAALATMLESGRMPEADRPAAEKALVALAVKRGDPAEAVARLEALVKATPDDAFTHANLAALYAEGGRHDQARQRMTTAVSLVRARGQTPPPAWTDYLQAGAD